MGCFWNFSSKSSNKPALETAIESDQVARIPKEELLLQIPGCTVNLVQEGETVEIAQGCFNLVKLSNENVPLAILVKVGDELQWPLTKDEPVVKLDELDYLFSLPMKDKSLLSYGVTFSQQNGSTLSNLDSFLKEHSCFSGFSSSTTKNTSDVRPLNWEEFAPRIEDYNGVLAKAIATGTGEIIKGIFKLSNAYTKQVQKGGAMIITEAAEEKKGNLGLENNSNKKSTNGTKKKSGLNKGLKRVRTVSKMTEKLSKTVLNTVGYATGSVMGPIVRSQAGKQFLAMVPGEVLLVSLDAVNRIFDAAEVAEKQALSATSKAATTAVSNRYGENAGEATEHVFATAGHAAGTAWNIFKIRKAINPVSSVTSGIAKSAIKKK
ncbi:senescence/dehydration-associated protein At4g35985, chloroplastic-like [Papaver somniferum]|uniref:senescence/dehydration-associated protein At4g35985, chloroplastic-like n=1 Tax=Papaver somniferum TaxID=3469 RepID=UPI000E6F7382|nr:senescence/dehydration-associated protein At4g35985, chloroplastic-like [Papaver somniferum]